MSSVNITTSARHGLVAGQLITITRNSVSGINGSWYEIGEISPTVFSIATSISPGTGGTLGDGGRSIQTGRLRNYLMFLTVALVGLFAGVFAWVRG